MSRRSSSRSITADLKPRILKEALLDLYGERERAGQSGSLTLAVQLYTPTQFHGPEGDTLRTWVRKASCSLRRTIGQCGIAWRDDRIVGVQLPETTEDESRARLRRRFPDLRETTPPPDIQHAINRIVGLLAGEHDDLASLPLDMDSVPDFDRRVYEIARTVPPGETMTYGEIAKRVGGKPRARRSASGRRWGGTRSRRWCRATEW